MGAGSGGRLARMAAAALMLLGLWPVLHAQDRQATPAAPLDLFDLGAPSFTTFSARDGVPDSVIVNPDRSRRLRLARLRGRPGAL